jgi:gliding motility-associated-like protein
VFNNLSNTSYTVYVRESISRCGDTATAVLVYCNVAPVGVSDFNCTKVNTALTGNVVTNDFDLDRNKLKVTAQLFTPTQEGGVFSVDTLGNYLYTPLAGFIGYDTIRYTVCDSVAVPECSEGKLIVKVSNQGVYANVDSVNMNMGESLVSVSSILANDSTDDGGLFSLNTVVTNAATAKGGSITIDLLGNYSYVPASGFYGTDSYTYSISDLCGVADTAELRIVVKDVKLIPVFIPEGFSPNGDGNHEYFVLENIEGYSSITIKVFNRWGSLVYENDNYRGPDWWDGNSNNGLTFGDKLPDGTYFYQITIDGVKYPGYLTLKR